MGINSNPSFLRLCFIITIFFIFSQLLTEKVWASYKTIIYDTPTAISLEKGEYNFDSFFYGNGGILFKFGIGINTFFNLGVTEYTDRMIGRERPILQIPNVSARIRFTDQPLDSFNFAIGFDSLYHGTSQILDKKLYGAYFVYTQGFLIAESPQLFSLGVRQPLMYEIIEPDVFASLYFSISDYFHLAFEINNIHFVKQYDYYFINNNILIFRPVQELAIEINLQVSLTHDPDPNRKAKALFSKELRIYYQSFF